MARRRRTSRTRTRSRRTFARRPRRSSGGRRMRNGASRAPQRVRIEIHHVAPGTGAAGFAPGGSLAAPAPHEPGRGKFS